MRPELAGILAATAWAQYYEAYQSALRSVVCDRWGLGAATGAGHVHHLAIPDVSGQVSSVSWAAYTQPSAETLLAALPLFADLLRREPARITGNRYIFFVAREPCPTQLDAQDQLGDMAGAVRLSVKSIEAELNGADWLGPVSGSLALGADEAFGTTGLSIIRLGNPREVIEGFGSMMNNANRVSVDDAILLGGSLVLSGYRAGIPVSTLSEILGPSTWLYATAAHARALESLWGVDALAYSNKLCEARGLEFDQYIVQPGDILGRVVRSRYNTPFERLWPTIRAANPELVDANRIRAGQAIRLPKI